MSRLLGLEASLLFLGKKKSEHKEFNERLRSLSVLVWLDSAAGRSQTPVNMWDTWQQLCSQTWHWVTEVCVCLQREGGVVFTPSDWQCVEMHLLLTQSLRFIHACMSRVCVSCVCFMCEMKKQSRLYTRLTQWPATPAEFSDILKFNRPTVHKEKQSLLLVLVAE